MDISRDEQRVLHALAQGGLIKPLKNAKGRIDRLELYNRDGWRMPFLTLLLFKKLQRKKAIKSQDGEPYRIAGSFEDMTQIKDVQHALEERERQLGEALASSEREVEELHVRLGEELLHGMVGSSQAIRTVYRRLRQAALSYGDGAPVPDDPTNSLRPS